MNSAADAWRTAQARAASLADEIVRGGAWYWDDEELETRGLATDPGSAGLLEDELRSALAERGWTMWWTSDGLEFRPEEAGRG